MNYDEHFSFVLILKRPQIYFSKMTGKYYLVSSSFLEISHSLILRSEIPPQIDFLGR